MNAEEDAKQRDLKRRQHEQRITNTYKRLFASEDGKAVLEDLEESFRLADRVFLPVKAGDDVFQYDPLTAALTDGARSVVIYIRKRLAAKAEGDANIQPQEKIRR